MSTEPTGERLTELRQAFAALDTDGDGFITEKEFADTISRPAGRRRRVAEQVPTPTTTGASPSRSSSGSSPTTLCRLAA